MFNKTLIHTQAAARDQHIRVNTEINEHRAPTDDSVQLLREMEEAARNSIIQSLTTEDNELINAEVNVTECNFGRNRRVSISFLLNGTFVEVKTVLDHPKLYADCDYIEHVRSALVTAITEVLLSKFAGNFRELFRR